LEYKIMHIPVLQKEIIGYLNPSPDGNFVDCTIDGGGHAAAILERNGKGKVLGIDWDKEQIEECKSALKRFEDRLVLVNDSYDNLKDIIEKYKFGPIRGILLDLGMSSWHLEESGRGFSFSKDEPLDMRYNLANNLLTASEIINKWPRKEIEKILAEYGEEKYASRIAEKIAEERKERKIERTFQLAKIIEMAVPEKYKREKIHFATRTFQGLRIAVNSELKNLKNVLPQAIDVLAKGGSVAVISFHSLEDRIVKNFFKESAIKKSVEILTKKPITAGRDEIKTNRRSRSAKLRVALKI